MNSPENSGLVKIKRALISVSDKSGLEKLVRALDKFDVKIISTGRTQEEILSYGIKTQKVSDLTGFEEMMDGRVKTLHPKVHAAILADRLNADHMKDLSLAQTELIDMVVVNLYPFEKTVSRKGVKFEEAIENIDIGGPTLLRSAAKNCKFTASVCETGQYDEIVAELEKTGGALTLETRRKLAGEVFARTEGYDRSISEYFRGLNSSERSDNNELFPQKIDFELEKKRQLRYGENPHQKAAFYKRKNSCVKGLAEAEQLQGKELSFNNIMDLSSAIEIVKPFRRPAASIVKHTNPCGVSSADNLQLAFMDALDCDRMSAFGGIIAFNRPVDGELAKLMLDETDFIECLAAPDYKDEALEVFKRKKNLRVIKLDETDLIDPEKREVKFIPAGALIQETDLREFSAEELESASKEEFPPYLIPWALFGLKAIKGVKSNAIILVQGTKTVGIGAGQMSRVDAVRIALRKAGERAKGACMISDAFFPHPDSVELAGEAGVAGIVQPGGSIRDEQVIEACRKLDMPMLMTGVRHFKH